MNFIILLLLLSTVRGGSSCSEKDTLKHLVRSSDIVLVAEVIEVKSVEVPGWSGTMPVEQLVRYRIKKILKGNIAGDEIIVGHYLYYGSLTADKEIPRLSPGLFYSGNDLLVFASVGKGRRGDIQSRKRYFSKYYNCGAVAANSSAVKLVQDIVRSGKR